ncbi:MAG: type IV pilin protein [Pseudomonadales bacterium]
MNRLRGFTLIEVMIVVAIIGVIAAIAFPSYQDGVQKSRRATAQGDLQQLRQAMERHFTKNSFSYLGAAAAGGDTGAPAGTTFGSTTSPLEGGQPYYNLTISAATANTYTLTATPIGAQVSDVCGGLTLTNTGLRASLGASANCWEN